MKHRIDFVLAQSAFDECLMSDSAPDDAYTIEPPAAHQLAVGDPVAHEADDFRALLDEGGHEPAAEKSGGAGDQGGPIAPKRAHGQIFHGARPLDHSDSSCLLSRRVSIGSQNESWR